MVQVNVIVELYRVERHDIALFASIVYHFSQGSVGACVWIVLSEPHVRVFYNALQSSIGLESLAVGVDRIDGISKVKLAVPGGDCLFARLWRCYLSVHLPVNFVDPWHPVPTPTFVYVFVLIRVGNARKCKLIVNCARVIAEGVSQRGRHWRVVKRVALSCVERFQFGWKWVAHWRQSYRVVLAALVEGYQGASTLFLILFDSFLEPVGRSASLAMLSFLIDWPKVVLLWPSGLIVCDESRMVDYLPLWTGAPNSSSVGAGRLSLRRMCFQLIAVPIDLDIYTRCTVF